ncbi:pentatricopeptide repeat-containing protein At5g43790 isoform X1 [Prosopis cineraria]|uniref:pentatricopeptide repeat-containing protein At5g43790 isoform X1 n=2 Tax=Prosopis cineraria TaxID=364024 RepID=UPI00240F9621|nr:pentatricopeptide repeat-containing protein At5g43790 isoform X1 [Prosopis cineraria]
MLTIGLALHTYPLSRLLIQSSKLSLTYAVNIFRSIPNPTIFLFNTLISSVTNHHSEHTHVAFSLYNQILFHNNTTLRPNSFTFPSLFKACASDAWLHYGQPLHTHVFKFLEPTSDRFVPASLVNFYAKCGKLNQCRYLFNQICEPDLAMWNTLLAAYTRNASFEDADVSLDVLHGFNEMQESQIRPNEVTFVALIGACSNLGVLSQGMWAHAYVLRDNIVVNRFVGTALVDMYSKCGCVNLAYQVFDKMPERDTFCYNAMIGGFAAHGHGHQALELYENMKPKGLVPDSATIVVTLFACSHVGLVEEGCEIFESMKEVHGIEPKLEHYGCLVDLLGRAGRLNEAEKTVQKMPMKPNAILWRALLGAARLHGNIEVGEVALKQLMQLEPETSGNYVLLSNMYANFNRWDDVKRVRILMKHRGVDKIPGFSLVEIGGAMHKFLTGDKTHPFSKEIYLKIEEMNRRLQEYGHKPRTAQVLFDMEEEDKEDALSYHSERLAIAFALIAASDSSSPIRILKNLRVCEDCHAGTKLMSIIYRINIVVRDRTRFHHFQDGTCSCKDYW